MQDVFTVASAVATFILGAGGVKKYMNKFVKALEEVGTLVDQLDKTIHDLENALADNELDKNEVEKIYRDLVKLEADFRAIIK